MKANEYKCDFCLGVFENPEGWTDAEKMEEKNRLFPDDPLEDCCSCCDDCFKGLGLG